MEFDNLVTEQQYSEPESSSTGGRRSSRDYPEIPYELAAYVVANLKAHGGSFHIPGHADDPEAQTLEESVTEALGVEEGTTNTLEALFGVDIDGKYLGTAGDLEPENGEVDRHATILVMKGVNGYHSDLVQEQFPGCSIGVGVGSSRKFDDDEKRNQWVQFRVVDTDKAERTRMRAQLDVGEINEEEYESWCVDNGFHPYPRRKDSPDLEHYEQKYADEADEE